MKLSVKIQRLESIAASDYSNMLQTLTRCDQTIQKVLHDIRKYAYSDIESSISKVIQQNSDNIQNVENLKRSLDEIRELYVSVEIQVLEQIRSEALTESTAPDGSASGEANENSDEDSAVWNYIWDALTQVVLGDFTDTSNVLGITLSVILGFVPYVGAICDVRDLIADVYNLFDDGPETSEWVALAFTLVGIIPGLDVFKHTDEFAPIFKRLDDIADGLGDTVKGAMKKADDICTAAQKYVDDFNDFMDAKIYNKISDKIDDIAKNIPHGDQIKDAVKDFLDKDFINDTVGDFVKELGSELLGIEDKVQGIVTNGINYVGEWVSDKVEDASKWFGTNICGGNFIYSGFSCVA